MKESTCEKEKDGFSSCCFPAPPKNYRLLARVWIIRFSILSWFLIGRCLNKAWDLTGIVFPLDFADGIFRRRKATGTLVLDVFFRCEGRRDKRERERSGEMKALVAGDANLTILPRKVSINVTRLINMQLITTHLSIKIKQLPEVFSRRFFHSLLSSRGKKTSGTRVSNRQNIRLFPQANKSQLYW